MTETQAITAAERAAQETNGNTLLRVENLVKHFPIKAGVFKHTVGQVQAVSGIDLEVKTGETLGVVGESGSGKSVTSLSIMGLHPPGTARISGQIQLAFNTAVTVLPHVTEKKLKPIAISTRERFPPLPGLQTVEEGGVKGYDGSSWQGVVMPSGTPREIVARVYQELATMLTAADTREKFLAQGALASGMPPEEFSAFVKREAEKWAKVARAAKVQVD